MKLEVPKNLIGTFCEARDEFYGHYRGIIAGNHKSYSGPRVNVMILECIEQPSKVPVLYKKANPFNVHVHRESYKPGDIHHFSMKDVILLKNPKREQKA